MRRRRKLTFKMEQECIFCSGKMEDNLISRYLNWTIYLHENQYYIGRTIVASNKHGFEDILSLNESEWLELKSILDKITKTVKRSYSADSVNYIVLQNKNKNHFHIQIIPRYKKEFKICEDTFMDENYGKSPIPTPEKQINKETKARIIKLLSEALN